MKAAARSYRHRLWLVMHVSLSSILMATTLEGCSEFTVRKISDGTASKDVQGIQFVLTKPEFTLTQTAPKEGSKDPTYTVSVDYVPDPKQTYTLQYRPGPFVDPTFGLTLGPGGTLAATNAAASDQFGPTIASLSTFTASLLGTVAKAAFDADSIRNPIVTAIKSAAGCSAQQRLDLESRILNELPDDQTFRSEFHYFDESEKVCLTDTYTRLAAGSAKNVADTKTYYDTAITNFRQKHPEDKAWLTKLLYAKENNDSVALEELKTPESPISDDLKNERVSLVVLAKNAVTATVRQDASKELKKIIELSAEAWRARHLMYLDRRINSINSVMLTTEGDHTAQIEEIGTLQEKRMLTLDTPSVSATKLYQRQKVLEEFVSKIERRSYPDGGSGPAMDEYAKARLELDEIRKQLDGLATAVLEAAKKAAPPASPPPPAKIVELRGKDFVDRDKRTPTKDDPEYVLILEEIQ